MTMFQVRFHGRGGQGVVTAAEMLSVAAFLEDKYAQAFPTFGSERMGAPVTSFCRISDHEIRSRDPISDPDALIIQDPTLLQAPDTFNGLTANGIVIINSSQNIRDLGLNALLKKLPGVRAITVPATELALKFIKRPLPNAAMLGGLAAMVDIIKKESIFAAIARALPGAIGEANISAAKAAFETIAAKQKELCTC